MDNSQKKKTEVLEVLSSLREKIITLLTDLDSYKTNQTQIIERYEERIRKKNEEIARLGQRGADSPELVRLLSFRNAVLHDLRISKRLVSINATDEELLAVIRKLKIR